MTGPTLVCRPLTLRPATPADDDLLAALMPADFDHDPTFPTVPGRSPAAHRDAWLRHWLHEFRHPADPRDVFHVFVVTCDDEPVGLQTLEGERFAETREVETTSFLIPRARGRRLGVAMRTAVLSYAFDVMGAARAITAARPDNVASRRVAERVGYEYHERREPIVAGRPRPIDRWLMTAQRWAALPHPAVLIRDDGPTR